MSAKTRTLIEHYAITFLAVGYGIYQTGNHNIKEVVATAGIAVFAPVAKTVLDKVKK